MNVFKKLSIVICIITMSTTLMIFMPFNASAKDTIVLKLGSIGSGLPTSYYHRTLLRFSELVGKKTNGEVKVNDCRPEHLAALIEKLEATGAKIKVMDSAVSIKGPEVIESVDIQTMPFPGFPTDLQDIRCAADTGLMNQIPTKSISFSGQLL